MPASLPVSIKLIFYSEFFHFEGFEIIMTRSLGCLNKDHWDIQTASFREMQVILITQK